MAAWENYQILFNTLSVKSSISDINHIFKKTGNREYDKKSNGIYKTDF